MAGTWADLTKQPGASVDTMLLLTDGTVIAHVSDSPNWRHLTPDNKGSYTTGNWSDLTPMPPNNAIPASTGGPTYGPLFFASAVLGDGTVLVAGGEYNTGVQPGADVAAATRFDPVTLIWTNVTTPVGWTRVGDAPLCVLADGRVLIGNINTSQTAFFDPATGTFSNGPIKSDQCSEESFVLLPDGTVLAVDCNAIPNAEKYLPSSNTWVSAGTTPSTLAQTCPTVFVGGEMGPTVVLPDGNALAIGATGDTAIYVPPANPSDPGTWQPGPTITDGSGNTLHPIDAPAVLLPNGRVLLAASPAPPCNFPGPTSFFEYDPAANSLTAVSSPSNTSQACFQGRFLLLPNGQVLFSNQSAKVTVYTPDGTPDPSWKPVITGVPAFMEVGHHYALTGTQFNGLSQACMYGDDATMATNYPVARLEQGTTVIYCRTAHHSTMGVATGAEPVSTVLSIPPAVPPGSYDLVVVANGISSDPVPVTIADQWIDNDLTSFAGLKSFAAPGSALDGYTDEDGSQHVNFIDGNGHVHELFRSPDPAAQWVDNDLTGFVVAGRTPAAPGSGLDGYSQSDGSQHVNFIDANGHVHELFRSPDPAAQWKDNDLTNDAGLQSFAVAGSGLDGYSQSDGSQHVNFIDANGHVHELFRSPDPAAQWKDNDLTNDAGLQSFAVAGSELDGYSQSDGSQHVNFIEHNKHDGNGHVHELFRSPDPAAQWKDNDLTNDAGLQSFAVAGSELDGYSQSDGSQHVNFIEHNKHDGNGHVHELFRSPDPAAQWKDNDLTNDAGLQSFAVAGSGLDGYSQSDGSQHVNFIDANGHVHELYRSPDPAAQWKDNDLTSFADGTPASGRSALDGYSQSDGSQHVNFIDANGHVHELYRNP